MSVVSMVFVVASVII